MNIKKRDLFLRALLLVLFAILLFLFFSIPDIEEEVKENIKTDSIATIAEVMENFHAHVVEALTSRNATSLEALLDEDEALRHALERQLNLLITQEFQYVYVVYKDAQQKFRFLLDGATSQKAPFKSKFDVDHAAWIQAYEAKETMVFSASEHNNHWITYLSPIFYKDTIQGMIAVDFSLKRSDNITNIIVPLKKALLTVLGFIVVVGFVAIVQYAVFYLTRKKAYVDPLTQLYNRQYLHDMIKDFSYQKYIIAMLDIDHFKRVNDMYGHDAGDKVLRRVCEALSAAIRNEDILVRYGGEEFLLLLPHETLSLEQTHAIIDRLRVMVEAIEIIINGIRITPTVSIGVNSFTDHFKTMEDAIVGADQMLYKAKLQGRNCVVCLDPKTQNKTSQKQIQTLTVHDVKNALESGRVFCEYQPIYDIRTLEVYKYESLIRIRNEEGTVFYPYSFLPYIMYSTVYKDLTKYVLHANFAKVQARAIPVSINLNITDILDKDIYERIIEGLEMLGDAARLITFELLEEEKIEKIDLLRTYISAIHATGARFALDDFGSGYSNFLHVLSLDIDIIKIDGSLIKDIDVSEISRALVTSITAFARASHKEVVVEYVHNQEVLEVVKALNIHFVQGYYLGKPRVM